MEACMEHDLSWRRRLVSAFDPFRELSLDECATLYVHREGQPSRLVVEALEEGEAERTRIALVGARGSGKSTELRRVMRTLTEDGSALVPILVDISAGLPDKATTVAWLPLVAAAVRAAREDWNGLAPKGDPLLTALEAIGIGAELLAPLMDLVRIAGPWFGPKGQAAAAGAAAVVELGEACGKAARAALEHPTSRTELDDLVEAMRGELVALHKAAGRAPVLLLDGLDKRVSTDSVFDALSDAALLYGLPAAIVISGPMALRLDGRFASFLMPGSFRPMTLHNLPVVDREGRPKEAGIAVLRELYRLRWEAAGLGPELLPVELVDEAARWSSGVAREFLALVKESVREAVRKSRDRVRPEDLALAVRERRHTMEITLDTSRWDVLADVLAHQERPHHELDDLLYTNAVACYQNDSVWYRPNELLVPYLQDRRRVEPS